MSRSSMASGVSHLPEHIIHQILSHMGPKEAARTSTFCKKWYSAWLTYPILDFQKSFNSFVEDFGVEEKLLEFFKHTLRRYQQKNICTDHLGLCLPPVKDSYSASLVDEWIQIGIKNGIKTLVLYFLYPASESFEFTLPCAIFQVKTLIELIVHAPEAKLVKGIDDKVMFSHLRTLHLRDICLDDNTFQEIIAKCALIEDLHIVSCEGLAKIRVTNLHSLKEFEVSAEANQCIEVDAPQLQYLDCHFKVGQTFNLYTTEKLKHLSLFGPLPSATFFDHFGHKFPQLEHLTLGNCHGLKRLKISSHSIKHLRLFFMSELRELEIDAPGMLSFQLCGKKLIQDLNLTNTPDQLVSQIGFYRVYTCDKLCELKGLLLKLSQSKISLALMHFNEAGFGDVRQIPASPVIEVEELHFGFMTKLTSPVVLDALFLLCHPKAIKCQVRQDDKKLTQFLYKYLIERRNQDCLTSPYHTKPWHKDLKEVRFEMYDEIKHEGHPISNWKEVLEAPQHWRISCFRLEWC